MPQRHNLVLTKDKNVKNDIDRDYSEVEVFSCFEEAIVGQEERFEKIFVVGGEKIYRESLSSCEEIFLTEVDANFDGDTFFPEIEWDNWIAVEKVNGRSPKTMNYGIVFVTLKEKTNISHFWQCYAFLPNIFAIFILV